VCRDISDLVKQLTAKLKAEKYNKIHIIVAAILILTVTAFFSFGSSEQILNVDEQNIAKINT
jgi:hypothetical protein